MKRYRIKSDSKEHFNVIITKLFLLGYVYSCNRCKTIEEIDKAWGYYPWIVINNDEQCNMVIHGGGKQYDDNNNINFNNINSYLLKITVEEFIENKLYQ